MKTSHRAVSATAIAIFCAFANPTASAQEQITIPTSTIGEISAYPEVVQTGTRPTLTWSIIHPSTLANVGKITPPGEFKINPNIKDIYVTVQIIGNDVTSCTGSTAVQSAATDARISINGAAYQQLFYGSPSAVNPSSRLFVKKLPSGTTINFGGRFISAGSYSWSPFYTTNSRNLQVIALVKGEVPPTIFPLHTSPRLKPYLKPYLDSSGKVNIGPMSMLIMMELGGLDRTSACYDYQDQVLLVTFSAKHPNNGHGNNLDGVDSSNPGNGHGGPNGEVDPSGGIDDES